MIEPLSSLNVTVLQRARINMANSSPDEFSALTYLLQGILFAQMFLYWLVFRRTDPIYLRITVLLIFTVELASTLLATVMMIKSIIFERHFVLSLLYEPAFMCICIFCGLAAAIVQGSCAWRIHLLGGGWKITVPIMILSVTQCVMVSYWGSLDATAKSVLEFRISESSTSGSTNSAIFTGWLVSSTICDIIISATLFYLRKQIRSTQNEPLIARVKRAMTIAIDTGVLTALSALVQLLLFLSLEDSLVDFTVLMATLNARIIVKAGTFPDDIADDTTE
ncbi:hypothetical protein BDP27DRAFT_1328244, partial [Rhodocollybia butyracea]